MVSGFEGNPASLWNVWDIGWETLRIQPMSTRVMAPRKMRRFRMVLPYVNIGGLEQERCWINGGFLDDWLDWLQYIPRESSGTINSKNWGYTQAKFLGVSYGNGMNPGGRPQATALEQFTMPLLKMGGFQLVMGVPNSSLEGFWNRENPIVRNFWMMMTGGVALWLRKPHISYKDCKNTQQNYVIMTNTTQWVVGNPSSCPFLFAASLSVLRIEIAFY